jgi:anthrone oxygenase-like protein
MQAPLALVGSLLGLLAWWETKDWRWLLGSVVLVANWPYTLFAIMPINNELKAINSASAGSKSRMLIERWGRLHAVRSVLGFAATLIFLWSSMR